MPRCLIRMIFGFLNPILFNNIYVLSIDHDDFLNFVFNFSDIQLSIIAQFMSYESDAGFFYASKACMDFWEDYSPLLHKKI